MFLLYLPNVDPIPLPAPVWLFKLLHIVTLVLHFIAVELILGGLTIATLWNAFGKSDAPAVAASNSVMKKLPTVMTYVINFGVPPLLFAQVLYGQALYTSSVLIGVYWIAVIFLLIAGYYLLYLSGDRIDAGRKWWPLGIVSLLLLAYVARIYSTNMTLMLRPNEWLALYQQSGGLGNVMPKGDPTTLPRFLFMTIGSLGFAGIGIALVGQFFSHAEDVKDYLIKRGALIGAIFMLIQMACGVWVYSAQPAIVQTGLSSAPLGFYGMILWAAASAIALLAAAGAFLTNGKLRGTLVSLAGLGGALMTAGAVVARDSIRDLSLAANGFDVWNRSVSSNWQVVSIFLVLFVAAVVFITVLLVAVNRSMKEVKQNA